MAFMKRSLIFSALGVLLWSLLTPLSTVRAGNPSPSDCPSCTSFGVQKLPPGKEAPPFTLKNLQGGYNSLAACRGKPTLLFFWGSWCEACKEDMVLLEKFATGRKDQLAIFTVVVDGERERRIREIIKKFNVNLPVLLVLKEKIIDAYEVRMVPMAVIVNQEGGMVGKVVGQRDWSKPEAWAVVKELCGLR